MRLLLALAGLALVACGSADMSRPPDAATVVLRAAGPVTGKATIGIYDAAGNAVNATTVTPLPASIDVPVAAGDTVTVSFEATPYVSHHYVIFAVEPGDVIDVPVGMPASDPGVGSVPLSYVDEGASSYVVHVGSVSTSEDSAGAFTLPSGSRVSYQPVPVVVEARDGGAVAAYGSAIGSEGTIGQRPSPAVISSFDAPATTAVQVTGGAGLTATARATYAIADSSNTAPYSSQALSPAGSAALPVLADAGNDAFVNVELDTADVMPGRVWFGAGGAPSGLSFDAGGAAAVPSAIAASGATWSWTVDESRPAPTAYVIVLGPYAAATTLAIAPGSARSLVWPAQGVPDPTGAALYAYRNDAVPDYGVFLHDPGLWAPRVGQHVEIEEAPGSPRSIDDELQIR